MTTALIGCEYSATVRDAFRAKGVAAVSCDILPTEGDPAHHIQGDVLAAIKSRDWCFIMLHLPCTAMAVCGNSTYGRGMPKHRERLDAIEWSCDVVRAAIGAAPFVALENPCSVIFPILRERLGADVQYIQPYKFGHMEQKRPALPFGGCRALSRRTTFIPI